jgi:hypothetical protein
MAMTTSSSINVKARRSGMRRLAEKWSGFFEPLIATFSKDAPEPLLPAKTIVKCRDEPVLSLLTTQPGLVVCLVMQTPVSRRTRAEFKS